jgi:hypothetical protein
LLQDLCRRILANTGAILIFKCANFLFPRDTPSLPLSSLDGKRARWELFQFQKQSCLMTMTIRSLLLLVSRVLKVVVCSLPSVSLPGSVSARGLAVDSSEQTSQLNDVASFASFSRHRRRSLKTRVDVNRMPRPSSSDSSVQEHCLCCSIGWIRVKELQCTPPNSA